jgi:ribonuclease P protein component
MLKKSARLTRQDVEEVLKYGRSVSILTPKGQKSLISAKFLAKPGTFRAAAVAPKAVAKSAVVRNKLRRAVYRAIANLPAPKNPGIAVFFVRAIPKSPLTPAFEEEIQAFLARI